MGGVVVVIPLESPSSGSNQTWPGSSVHRVAPRVQSVQCLINKFYVEPSARNSFYRQGTGAWCELMMACISSAVYIVRKGCSGSINQYTQSLLFGYESCLVSGLVRRWKAKSKSIRGAINKQIQKNFNFTHAGQIIRSWSINFIPFLSLLLNGQSIDSRRDFPLYRQHI